MPKKAARPLVVPIAAESSVGELQRLDDAPSRDQATRADVARDLDGFDLGRMRVGGSSGVNRDRVRDVDLTRSIFARRSTG